jgi:hypothetical protein
MLRVAIEPRANKVFGRQLLRPRTDEEDLMDTGSQRAGDRSGHVAGGGQRLDDVIGAARAAVRRPTFAMFSRNGVE